MKGAPGLTTLMCVRPAFALVHDDRARHTLRAIVEKIQGMNEWRAKWDIVLARCV